MSYHISYRDYEESHFDIKNMSLEDVESTNELLNKALNAIPIDEEEKNLLDEYIHTLRTYADHQTAFNKAKTLMESMLQQGNQRETSFAESLAREAAVAVSHCEQTLFSLEVSEALKSILERDQEQARILRDEIAQIEKEREELSRQYDEFMKQRQASKQQAIKAREESQRKEEQQKTSSTKEVQEQDYTKRMLWLLMPMVLSITVPLLMLDTPIWLMSLIDLVILSPMLLWSQKLSVIVPYAYHIIRPILYISALVVTILGVQDFLAIAFYILMAIQIPRMIKNFIGTILIIYYAIPIDKE